MSARILITGLLAALVWPDVATAAVRAWLDRGTLALGDSVTLTVDSDQAGPAPDFSVLRRDFELGATRTSRQLSLVDGALRSSTQYVLELRPRRSGQLTVPPLAVAGQYTPPLPLTVSADASAGAAVADGRLFLRTEVDDASPYVQQSVGVVVRLYYATALASGELDLQAPPGASLQRVGEDRNDVSVVDGRRYHVVERRFLLIPERSGRLQLPSARFQGRVVGDPFDPVFDAGDGRLSAASAPVALQVRPQPTTAPTPWLPLHALQLDYAGSPGPAVAGQALNLTMRAVARGAVRAQFPELPVPQVPGAQVLPEPAQYEERFDGAVPVLTVTRRYALVPQTAGVLEVPALAMDWWDVAAARPRQARLPALRLSVAPAAPGARGDGENRAATGGQGQSRAATPAAAPATAGTGTGLQGLRWKLPAAALAIAIGLLLIAWAVVRRRRGLGSDAPPPAHEPARPEPGALQQALAAGALDEIEGLLRRLAPRPAQDIDGLCAQLDDPAQQAALELLARARWRGEDAAAARTRLRQAFAAGPRWRRPAPVPKRTRKRGQRPDDVLPPLYPSR